IAEGTRVSKVTNLTDDIKLSMAVTDVRIEAPIPGKSAIGIEVPNKVKSMVSFKELVASKEFKGAKSKISFCVGKDISGEVIVGNIEKMPHLLIAGATGSGKSVCINTMIMSILYHATPDEVKMIMVDPKMVELSVYNGIPHLLLPVITDAKKAAGALHWAVKEMMDRYELFAQAGVRNLEGFNEKADSDALPEEIKEEKRVRMSQLVIILDEVADLMMVAAADVEDSIVRLAQLARAAGIHLIIATQKPTVNVITGLIKANVPSRIAFSVSSGNDSRVILDMNGAEDLLGNGDMLYAPQNLSKPIRVQGAFVSDEEVSAVVDFLKNNNDADYNSDIETQIQNSDSGSGSVSISGEPDNSRDQLFNEAGRLVIENQKGSIGYLQRNFRIGFNRAARIMDQLAEAGVVGPEMGTKPREIRMSISEFEELINAQ
ncbi:MAG: DNA translocase FtsK, partial [Pseudobutyrivibrio sp.]|nr:DNA translocase FtsK [Pseudobutyrivibrio sp.]